MLSSTLKKPAQKREIVLAILICGALFFMFFRVLYSPKAAKVADFEKTIAELDTEIESLNKFNEAIRENRKKQLAALDTKAQKRADDDPRLQLIQKSRAPEFRLFADFIKYTMSQRFRSSVDIQALTYSEPTSYNGFSATGFNMVANGPYSNTISFLNRLEAIPALLTITEFKLQVNPSDSNLVTMTLKADFFQLEEDDA